MMEEIVITAAASVLSVLIPAVMKGYQLQTKLKLVNTLVLEIQEALDDNEITTGELKRIVNKARRISNGGG